MSTPDAAPDGPASAPRKRGRLLLLIGIPVLLAAALGGGLFAARAGLVPGIAAAPAKPAGPELQYEDEPGPNGPKLKTSYFKIPTAFTTNLAGSERLVQVEIGVATHYDERVIQAVEAHELPIRSAVLAVLAQQGEAAVQTPAGRAALQKQLCDTINRVLKDKVGFGGIAEVYFASLIIQ